MTKIRLSWPWRGTVLRGQKESLHAAGDVVNVDPDTARNLVRKGLAARVPEDDAPTMAPPGAATAPADTPSASKSSAPGAGKES